MSNSNLAPSLALDARGLSHDAAAQTVTTATGLHVGYLPLADAAADTGAALRQAGCDVIRTEISGDGRVLAALVAFLARGDRLVAPSVRCIPSGYGGLLRLLHELDLGGASAVFIDEGLSTDGEAGRLLRAAARAVAELQPARRAPRPTAATRARALTMAAAGARPGEIARAIKVSRMTLWRWLRTAEPARPAE